MDNQNRQGYTLHKKLGWLPEEWEIVKLESLGSFSKGKGIAKKELSESGIPCIRYGEIYTKHHFQIKEFHSFINEEVAQKSNPIFKNDILFVGSGETLEEIGKCVAYLKDEKAYAGGDIIILRLKNGDAQFLSYLLNHDIAKKQKYQLGQGNSVVHIYSSGLKKLKIPLPPLAEQQKIAKILTTWDTAIQTTKQLLATKRQQKKGLMQRLLTGQVRFEEFVQQSGFQKTKIGDVPKDWEVVKLGELGEVVSGLTYSPNDIDENGILVLRSSNVQKRALLFTNNVFVKIENDKFNPVKRGDILICVRNGSKSLIGKNALVTKKEEGMAFGAFMSIFRSSHNQFLFQLFGTDIYKKQVFRNLGATINSINSSNLKKFVFPLPPKAEQQKIAQVLTTADTEIQQLEQKLSALQAQKQGLMQQLLTGAVRVNIE